MYKIIYKISQILKNVELIYYNGIMYTHNATRNSLHFCERAGKRIFPTHSGAFLSARLIAISVQTIARLNTASCCRHVVVISVRRRRNDNSHGMAQAREKRDEKTLNGAFETSRVRDEG